MKTYIDNALEEFDLYSQEIFFAILGDTTYVVDVLDNNGIHQEELEKRNLHNELKKAYKKFFKQKLQEALAQQKEDIIKKLEGEKKQLNLKKHFPSLTKLTGIESTSSSIINNALDHAIEIIKGER